MSTRLTAAAPRLEARRRPGPVALFSNAFKADPRLAWIPGDLTLLAFLASVGAGVIVIFRERVYLTGLNLTF